MFISATTGFMVIAPAVVIASEADRIPAERKSTNVKVDSSDLEPFSINEKTEPKEKRVTFYSDQNSAVDVNENGEPNLNMRF